MTLKAEKLLLSWFIPTAMPKQFAWRLLINIMFFQSFETFDNFHGIFNVNATKDILSCKKSSRIGAFNSQEKQSYQAFQLILLSFFKQFISFSFSDYTFSIISKFCPSNAQISINVSKSTYLQERPDEAGYGSLWAALLQEDEL